MPITDRGRWTSAILDERGRIVKGSITEIGGIVFGTPSVPPQTPTAPPLPTVISVSRGKISDETGVNSAVIRFKFDTDVTQWSVNVMGVSSDTGTIADSGGNVTAGTEITASIEWNELYQEGQNKVNIYGLNSFGWTPYEEDPNAVKKYYLQMDGVDDWLQFSGSIGANTFILDVEINSLFNDGYKNILDCRPVGVANSYYNVKEIGAGYTSYKIDNVNANRTINDTTLPKNKRILIELTTSIQTSATASDQTIRVFGRGVADEYVRGKIYNITCKNSSGTTVAYYDMSTGTIQDISGNGNHATLSGGTWQIENQQSPKYYLQMDGVDDVVDIPSLTANEVVIDMVLDANAKNQGIVTLSNGYIQVKTDGSIIGNNFTPNYIDGVLYNATTNPFPFGRRFTYKGMYGSGVTATGFLFRATSNGTQAKGRLYSAKYYNNGVLVAHYDFSNGTTSDISGNGKHATLTGNPTWVSY